MAVSLDQFKKTLIASGLLTADEVTALWNAIPEEGRPTDGSGFAKWLVDRTKLTPFQAAELLAGRGARLILGDYTILAEIGAGGMGQVYKARHRRMKRTVAIKVMSNAAMKDSAAVKRFQREVQAAAKLEHPNIVTAYDSGEVGGMKYLVMQFVDGGDLADLVKKQGRLGIEQAVGYVLQAASGLAFAHGEGVIHRDIKPANLLLDKDGVVKILDMGLARFEDGGDGLTATEQVMGTVDYMSPEQASDTKHADARADIYSLGCTLWYLLTARKLYEADTLIGRLMKHRDGPLPSLVKERDDASWPLEQVLHKMIAKRSQDRYQSMNEVIAALAPYGGDTSSSGSSIGIGSGIGRSADLASFMQSMESGGTKPSGSSASHGKLATAKPGTATNFDATAKLNAPDVGTDSKQSAIQAGKSGSTSSLSSTSTGKFQELNAGTKQAKARLGKLIAVGALGAAIVVAGIVIKVRNDEGNVAAEASAPRGAGTEVVAPLRPAMTSPAVPSIVPVTKPPSSSAVKNLTVPELLESTAYVWSKPENLGPNINTSANEQSPTLTADQLCLIFIRVGDGSDLLEVRRASSDAPWGMPVRLKGCDHERDPSLSADGLTLFFCSNGWKEPGYLGGYDIWFRRRATRDAAWGPPQNVGAPINMPDNEGGPALSADGLMLAFHATRAGGQGNGHDIWVSRRAALNSPWSVPENLGAKINSSGGEMNPRFIDDDKSILFERGGNLHITFRNSLGINGAISLPNQAAKYRWPWISVDGGSLYFHSNELSDGLGGDDIWLTRRVPRGGS